MIPMQTITTRQAMIGTVELCFFFIPILLCYSEMTFYIIAPLPGKVNAKLTFLDAVERFFSPAAKTGVPPSFRLDFSGQRAENRGERTGNSAALRSCGKTM